MRHFTYESGTELKFVVIEVRGHVMRLVQGKRDGITRRTEKELASEADAHVVADRMADELIARGFTEQIADRSSRPAVRPLVIRSLTAQPAMATTRVLEPRHDGLDLDALAAASEGDAVEPEALLPRLAPPAGTTPSAEAAPKKPKKAAGKKKKAKAKPDEGDKLDKRVIAAMLSVCLGAFSFAGRLGYDVFLKPPSIVGYWEGSRTEHEKGKYLINTQYRLILDARKNAALARDKSLATGTYAVQGDQLKLTFKDEDGDVSETVYQISLGRSTLDLFDPKTGDKVVELLRFRDKPATVAIAKPAEAPKNLAGAPIDKAADDKLAGVEFTPKDGAFRLKRPLSWEVESGSRPDNTYSWARFTQDSAKVQVFADIAGSLMAGPNQSDHEAGSELAPVHSAHELYAKKAAEEVGDGYTESAAAPIQSAGMGEGRIATFEASGGGLFGSKVRGIRVTYLTNDRRISIICQAPASQFAQYQPTFLAIARSLGR